MRRLVLKMSISLDGYVAGPNGEADWMFRHRDEAGHRWVEDTLWQAGLHVMGSRSYFAMLRAVAALSAPTITSAKRDRKSTRLNSSH